MTQRILSRHFDSIRKTLIEHSKYFNIARHGTVKGYIREALIQEYLRRTLPSIVEYSTGEIVDVDNQVSGQIDIILQSISEPRIQLYENYHIALCDAVHAVIEVKSTLTTGKPTGKNTLVQALKTFEQVKRLKRLKPIAGIGDHKEPKKTIPCILFAYSGPAYETLHKAILAYSNYRNYKENEWDTFLPEIIVVLDKGYYLCKNDGWIFSKDTTIPTGKIMRVGDKAKVLEGPFVYLCNLLQSANCHPVFSNYVEYLK